jgi:hypothetical protein
VDIHRAFQVGAQRIAAHQCRYTNLHKSHGIIEANWDLLTQDEYWSPEEVRQMPNILSQVVEVAMTISGMPAVALPGQYVAAVIAEVVAPVNRFLACMKAPDTFDAVAAAGVTQTHEVKPMSREQLQSLVLLYSGDFVGEPPPHRLDEEVTEAARQATRRERKRPESRKVQ